MHEATTDLRECKDKIKKGDLVLLVNESFTASPDVKRQEPSIILSEFKEFISGCNRYAGYFRGANIYFIKKSINLTPDITAILCTEAPHRSGADYISVRANRIYIGKEAVNYGIKNDPLVAKLLNLSS
jgi:hypothetical protein